MRKNAFSSRAERAIKKTRALLSRRKPLTKAPASKNPTRRGGRLSGDLASLACVRRDSRYDGAAMSLKVEKGTRHTKIVGIFGEYVVCNWLSRTGFETSVIDHTGMDLIACDPKTGRRLGITVKSRTRGSRKETASVNIVKNKHQDQDELSPKGMPRGRWP